MFTRVSRVVAESGFKGAALRLASRMVRNFAARMDQVGQQLVSKRQLRTLTSKKTRALLAPNAVLLARHEGQTAFIVGAGPSLRDQNLAGLAAGIIIAVNQSFLHLKRLGIRPAYIMVIDRAYFEPRMRTYIDDLCAYALEVGAELLVAPDFLPLIPTLPAVPTYHLFGQIMRDRDFGFGGAFQDVDLTVARPAYETVVHGAVAAAIYMRFAEIHILGCDGNFFIDPHAPFDHVYSVSPYDTSTGTTSELFCETQPELLQRAAREFQAFVTLNAIASRQGSSLFNAGLGGHLEVLPRQRLDGLDSAATGSVRRSAQA